MIHELRIYKLHKGKQSAFLKEFHKARRFMDKYGITFVAAWETDREDEFVWMRSFPSQEMRDKAISAYYSSPEWMAMVDAIRPLVMRRTVRVMSGVKVVGTQI